MQRRGFTVVELVVVMVIMAILVLLGIFGVTKSQANARDAERKADAETIARGLEQRYKYGNPQAVYTADGSNSNKPGEYPSTTEMLLVWGFANQTNWNPSTLAAYPTDEFPGTNAATFISPSGKNIVWCFFCGTSTAEDMTAGKYIEDSVMQKDTYVYEPITADNQICTGPPCPRFNLYYKSEVDKKVITIRSEHQ